MVFRSALSALLALTLLFAPGAAQQDTGLATIRAVYHDLLELFYRPLDGRGLLRAGWSALQSDAAAHAVSVPPPLPDLPDDPDQAFEVFAGAYGQYVARQPSPNAYLVMVSAMADNPQEQHTHYLPASVMQRFLNLVGGGQQSIGLGIKLGGDLPGLITEVAPESPAARAGLQVGDVIVAVDGREMSGTDTQNLATALTGAAGTTVSLTIDRGLGPQTVEARRGAYYFPPLESRLLEGDVGYLRLTDFVISGTNLPNGTELLSDLDRRLDELDAQGAQSWVLDLRNNGGGSVQTADELLGRFLPDTARSVRESDQRGHVTYELAAGRTRARQLPMAVLINGGSASASEVVAAALRDARRALLVGQRTAGAVASSELLPLPDGGGLQIAVAAVTSAESGAELDEVGIMPDVFSGQSRSLSDYRAGRDPVVEAAIAALATAPAPPSVAPAPLPFTGSQIAALLETVLPPSSDLPRNDRFQTTNRWQRLDYLHPNELIDQNGGSPDPLGLQQAMRARGYQGSVMATYGSAPGNLPSVTVNADLYGSADGAHTAVSTNDLPFLLQPIDSPVAPGDEAVTYRGTWLATGSTQITWRRGRLVVTVSYSDVPGFERLDTLAGAASVVDARVAQLTLP